MAKRVKNGFYRVSCGPVHYYYIVYKDKVFDTKEQRTLSESAKELLAKAKGVKKINSLPGKLTPSIALAEIEFNVKLQKEKI